MGVFFWCLSLIIFITKSDIYDCPRVHKAWHLSTTEEKQLFIDGVHQLDEQGKLKYFGLTHHNLVDSSQAHDTSEFFAWHRYFLWEFENQIRRLGPEFECFALPYWDVTTDAGLFEDADIFNSGLGGIGDIQHDECVDISDNGAWSVESFPLPHVCHEDENRADNPSHGCCLKRASARGQDLSGVSSYTQYIKEYNTFGADNGFRSWTFWGKHGEVHGFVGGGWDSYTQMISRYAPEDPIFFLLHSWLDYVFVVWKQCWGHNLIDPADLDDHPEAYFAYPKEDRAEHVPSSQLDDAIMYAPMKDLSWWEGNERNPTARKMWDEKVWNMQFEKGTFIARSHLTALCTNDWDTDILVENSEDTKTAIQTLRANDAESELDRYQHKVWSYMDELMSDDTFGSSYEMRDYLQTWTAKTCNFQRQRLGKEPCYVPVEYEKCSEDDLERKHELTLDELLEKEGVKGNACLEEVRIYTYPWAKEMGLLYELCMGKMDEYRVCNAPNIEFMIDADDEMYYKKMFKTKDEMKDEMNQYNEKILDDMDKTLPIVAGMSDYPRFDIAGYLIAAFVIGICAFIAIIGHCWRECTDKVTLPAKMKSHHGRKSSKWNYGSMVEML